MLTRKRLLLVVSPLLLIGAGVAYFAMPAGPAAEDFPSWEPKTPATSRYTVTPESSGEMGRKAVKTPEGKLSELQVGYADGRLGVYSFDASEKVQHFTCYAEDDRQRPIYEAWFGADSLLQRSRTLRVDGSLAAEFRRQLDGTEVRESFAADGLRVEFSATTLPDGSQRTARRGADGKVSVEEVKAVASERSHGERLGVDGIYTPIFKMKLVGVRVN